ncbi:MAG: pyridoxal-phosphate-dependent aminotransferase family protein [Verrucomicrobiota bacterium]
MVSYKLFIPGPIEVSQKTYKAMTTPVFGHRSKDFVALYESVQPGLKKLFYTDDPVFISTSSAWGVMEGCLRSITQKKVLNCCCGAFSDKWYNVTQSMGLEADAYQVEWGEALDPEAIRERLATGEYDVITLVHNETSTGVMNPLPEIAAVLREFPEVISVVDTVSSFSAVKIEKDALGIDIMLTGSQKALAMPPGMALFSVSERAFARAEQIETRGYYFDLLEFKKNHEKGMTPSTPIIPLIFALKSKLEDIFEEGVEARYARHAKLNAMVHEWVARNGFELFADPNHASKSLTCVANNRDIDLPALIATLKKNANCVIDGGYGKVKGKTFRISNMGDETEVTIGQLLKDLDAALAEVTG